MDAEENHAQDRQSLAGMGDVLMEALDLGAEDDDAMRIRQTQASDGEGSRRHGDGGKCSCGGYDRTFVGRGGGPCCSDQRHCASPRRRDKKSENDTCIYERAFVTSLTSPSVSEGLRDPSSASTLRHINFVGHGIMFI